MSTAATVTTVRGPVPAAELGVCSPHEHLLIDTREAYWRMPDEPSLREFALAPIEISNLHLLRRHFVANRDNLVLDDVELAVAELAMFRELGGGTVVDVTPAGIGRDPRALAEISERTGVHVVAGAGWYVHLAHPAELAERPLEALRDEIVRDVLEGIDNSPVRAGIIGEIGTSDPLHPVEEKVLRAAGQAQRATGVALNVHLHPPSRSGHAILDVLEEEGVALDRVVLSHVDISLGHLDVSREQALVYHLSLADRGCWIEYDTCGFPDACMPRTEFYGPFWFPSDRDRAQGIAHLLDAGFGAQLLIAQDVCHKMHLTRYGGYGYAHLLREFAGTLRDHGLGQEEIDMLLVTNPARMLSDGR